MIDRDKTGADRMMTSVAAWKISVEIKASNRRSNNVSGKGNAMSSAESRINSDVRMTILIAGEIAIPQVVCPISKGPHGDKGKSSRGVNAKTIFVAAMMIGSVNGNSASSTCD